MSAVCEGDICEGDICEGGICEGGICEGGICEGGISLEASCDSQNFFPRQFQLSLL